MAKKTEEFVSALPVNFQKVDMKSEELWTDDMTKSCFNQQPGLPSNGTTGTNRNSSTTVIKKRKDSMFQNRFR